MPIDISQLEQIVKTHQHTSGDFTQKLRNQDFNLVARNSLSSAASSLTLEGISAKKFLRVLIEHDAKSGNGNNYLRFNNVSTGTVYTFIENGNGVARASQNQIDLIDGNNDSLGYFYIIDIVNVHNLVNSIHSEAIARITSASTAQSRLRETGSFVNTSSHITRMDLVASSGNFPAGTSISVFGSSE